MMLILFSGGISIAMSAQRVSVSMDMLKWATVSPNISFDIILSPQLSLNIEGVYNPFDNAIKNLRLKQISISPELRYWFKRPLYSHYLGLNVLASAYDFTINNNRNKGQTIAIGVGYGYSLIISKRINLIPIIGIGCGYVLSSTNPELNVQSPIDRSVKLMLTRIGLSFSYIIN